MSPITRNISDDSTPYAAHVALNTIESQLLPRVYVLREHCKYLGRHSQHVHAFRAQAQQLLQPHSGLPIDTTVPRGRLIDVLDSYEKDVLNSLQKIMKLLIDLRQARYLYDAPAMAFVALHEAVLRLQ